MFKQFQDLKQILLRQVLRNYYCLSNMLLYSNMFQQQFWQHALQILQNLLHYSEIKIIKKNLNIFLSFINKKLKKNISSTCCQHSRTI